MKKKIILIICLLFIILIPILLYMSWRIPIKTPVLSKELGEYSENNIVLLCEVKQVTGYDWYVLDSSDKTKVIEWINLTGNSPEETLKRPLYQYAGNQFVLIGNFSKNNPEVFDVIGWEIFREIKRSYNLIPISPYYFNIWEISINNARKSSMYA